MWVKICGLNDLSVARQVAEAGPDAIGLNFYAKSKRVVTIDTAREIVAVLPNSVTPIGLFVNHTLNEIRAICSECSIGTIQLHGDETPEFAAELREYQIIRALRVSDQDDTLATVSEELNRYAHLGVRLFGCLVDAHVAGAYGGTGKLAPWQILRRAWQPEWPRLILAGGLHPGNVQDACQQVRPWGVDVASGVESVPGQQDPVAVRHFIQRARTSPEK